MFIIDINIDERHEYSDSKSFYSFKRFSYSNTIIVIKFELDY